MLWADQLNSHLHYQMVSLVEQWMGTKAHILVHAPAHTLNIPRTPGGVLNSSIIPVSPKLQSRTEGIVVMVS